MAKVSMPVMSMAEAMLVNEMIWTGSDHQDVEINGRKEMLETFLLL